jgi:predicted GH43/DUF377 family glycosyl hydrolase
MKSLFAILFAACLLSACGNSQQPNNAFNPATGWALWQKNSAAVYSATTHIASDPSVIADESVFRLAYTGVDLSNPVSPHASIGLATSADSMSWAPISNLTVSTASANGEVLRGRAGAWDENLETPFLMKTFSGYMLYYSGYRDATSPGGPGKGFPASLGVATSRDGLTFTRMQSDPILAPTPGGFDADAIYSPDIIPYQSDYFMVYAGHCYTDCPGAPGVRILGATSADGIHWSKLAQPLLAPSSPPEWMRDGVAEPAILMGPDGDLYLFFTGVKDNERVIGVARAASPTAAFEVDPDAILAPTAGNFDEVGDIAPSVMLENGTVRMWFVGRNKFGQYAIGYAEAAWPLHRDTKSGHSSGPVFALLP